MLNLIVIGMLRYYLNIDGGIMRYNHDNIVDQMCSLFSKDSRVQLLFTTGSTAKNSHTSYSDVDVWIVVREERFLESFIKDFPVIISNKFKTKEYYSATRTHYFFVIDSAIALDLNVLTAAQFFSARSSIDVLIKKDIHKPDVEMKIYSSNITSDNQKQLFLKGTVSLMRILSKIKKHDYVNAARFLSSLRDGVIVALLNRKYESVVKNAVDINFNLLPKKQVDLFNKMFIRSFKDDALIGLLAACELLEYLTKSVKDVKLRKLFNNTKKIVLSECKVSCE